MAPHQRPSPALNGEGAAFRKATPSKALLGCIERRKVTEPRAVTQERARECETIARRHALAALCLGGAAALTEVALSGHYAKRAVTGMTKGAL